MSEQLFTKKKERKSVLKIWHYKRQVAVYEKKSKCVHYLHAHHSQRQPNECKKANLTFGSSNGTTERGKRIHEYKSKNATTTNNYAKGI